MRAVDAVFNKPAAARPVHRRVFGTVTLLAWSGYLYLWLPLVTLAAWALGLNTAWAWGRRLELVDFGYLLVAGGLSIVLAGSLVLWAEHQRRRFTGKELRRRAPDATAVDVALSLGASVEVMAALQSGRVVRVHCRSDGRASTVETLHGARPAVAASGLGLVPAPRRPHAGDATSNAR